MKRLLASLGSSGCPHTRLPLQYSLWDWSRSPVSHLLDSGFPTKPTHYPKKAFLARFLAIEQGPALALLSLGLKFIRRTKCNHGSILKYYFKDSAPKKPHPFRGKSDWDPPRASREVEEYLHRVKEGLNNHNKIPNLGITEIKALWELSKDPTLVIKSAGRQRLWHSRGGQRDLHQST